MKTLKSFAFGVVVATLTACTQQQSQQEASTPTAAPEHVLTVKEYYDDNSARGAAIARCTSASEGQVNVNLQKPECKNALQAEKFHQLGMKPE